MIYNFRFARAFSLMLLVLAGGWSYETTAQRKPSKPRRAPKTAPLPPPPTGNPLDTAIEIGGDFLDTAARLLGSDPYGPFRGVQYSNDGLISETDEARVGVYVNGFVRRRYTVIKTGQDRLERIGQKLVAASPRKDLKFRFYVAQSSEINALSLPGGYVYVTTGLMKIADDDQLASVLGHEIGHIVARHGLKSIQHAQAVGQIRDLAATLAGLAGADAKDLAQTAGQLVSSGVLATHNRQEEREADYLGLHFMTDAGFNPEAMITMFQKVQDMSGKQPDLLGAIWRNHPDVSERISNTAFEIKKMREPNAK